jgi:acyl-CoA synthetase (AMP-forming)/AMP-acid ligase II
MVGTFHPAELAPLIETIDRQQLATQNRAVPTSGEGLRSVSTGRCLPGFEMQTRGADGSVLADREVGEIWLRSATLFAGYRGDPERSAAMVKGGWLNSGDRGYLVGEDLFFVSRVKDLIIIGGQNYAPHDIEVAIDRVPGVREGCGVAFGVMNEERGTEELAAVVETRLEDEGELAALQRAIRKEVTSTIGLGIRYLKLVPPGGIEKTTSGKLARSATYLRYADEFGKGA